MKTRVQLIQTRTAQSLKWIGLGCAVGLFAVLTLMLASRYARLQLDEDRSRLRRQYLEELQRTNQAALTTYGWIDSRRGIVRLPLERAIEISLELWKDAPLARSNLLERLSKATVKLPPKPNIYE